MLHLVVARKINGKLVEEIAGKAADREAAVWEGWSLRCNGYTLRGRRVEPGEIVNVRIAPTERGS